MAGRELSIEQCKIVIDKIYEMNEFDRINLAGGEPMLAPHLQEIINYVNEKGFACSLITNGSILSKKFIDENVGKLSMIGISIDSMNENINKLIGRETITNIVELSKEIKNAGITLKINVCVNKYNLEEDFIPLLDSVQPDRLKLLQVMITDIHKKKSSPNITRTEFDGFCAKLMKFNPICENNQHMKKVYWIVDSEGYFGKDNLHSDYEGKRNLLS